MTAELVNGWCLNWLDRQDCGGVGVCCLRAPGVPELCVACAARHYGLPPGTKAVGLLEHARAEAGEHSLSRGQA